MCNHWNGCSKPACCKSYHTVPELPHDLRDGICLSPLYDKAFDKGLIGIQPDYEIVVSKELKEHSHEDFFISSFAPIEHKKLILPEEHQPRPAFLQYHYDNIFSAHN